LPRTEFGSLTFMTSARRSITALISLALVVTVFPVIARAQSAPPIPSNVGCDPLDPSMCLFPFPNDFFTVADEDTDTGRLISFSPAAMPRNGTDETQGGEGKPMDPTEWNRNDGFSPGAMVMTSVPELDLHVTWGTQDRPHSEAAENELGYFDYRDHIADIGLYEQPDAPIVIINAETGERHPFWSELDTHPDAVAAGEQTLILRPATNFEEGARYVVALRDLKRTDGSVIDAGAEFAGYRSGSGTDAARQAHFDSAVFPVLEGAGVARDDLYLAWDFTVASERNLAERVLHMRDDAFGRILGDTDLANGTVEGSTPEFVIDQVEDPQTDNWTDSNGQQHSQQFRRVHGRVTVPNYLDRIQQTEGHVKQPGKANMPVLGNTYYDSPAPGSRLLDTNLDGLPDQNPVESTVNVPFVCEVPLNGKQNNATLYGHGLLGTRDQIGDIRSPRRDGPFFGCAADWWGMSTVDTPTVATILADMGGFASLPDRAQQGFLNFMFLGRAAIHPDGFAADPAFQNNGESLVNVADEGERAPLYYDGNSQGGIMGGSLVAVSPDIQRGILGVPGMNYSTLLNRSVDWEGEIYSDPMYAAYTDPVERQLIFALIQMLWDRGEANGYAHHMTDDPYENTPAHDVMLQVAFSDHQVTNVAAEVEARTIGAPIMTPGLGPNRHWEMDPYFADTATYPYDGSALVYWDSGNATPPNGNVPASQNGDPHSHPRREAAASWQEAHFLLTGQMYDVCGGGFYLTDDNPTTGKTVTCHAPTWAAGSTPPDPTPTETVTPTEEPSPTQTTDPGPEVTTLRFTEKTPAGGQFSDATVFEAALSDASGDPVEGAEVTFALGDSRTFTATTGADGIASVTPELTETPGAYTLTARYDGDDAFVPSGDVRNFIVEREDTSADLAITGKGSKAGLTARIADADSDAGVAGRTVEFFADGESVGTATTGPDGSAQTSLPARFRNGHHAYEAVFEGDEHYLGSRDQQQT
jgi:hypothetical protein